MDAQVIDLKEFFRACHVILRRNPSGSTPVGICFEVAVIPNTCCAQFFNHATHGESLSICVAHLDTQHDIEIETHGETDAYSRTSGGTSP